VKILYIPLPVRLALFYTLLFGLALLFFGNMIYTQAHQRAYSDLDNALSSRAASVRFGKLLACPTANSNLPLTILPSVDGLGTGGIAIEILDEKLNLLATTTSASNDPLQTSINGLVPSPVPWDAQAAQTLLRQYAAGGPTSMYTTITYQGQPVRVYSIISNPCSVHIVQTARSEQDIEQSLNDLRSLLIRGAALVLALALIGGWLITWGVLAAVHRITRTAQSIAASRNFSQRVPSKSLAGRDELGTLAATFNEMLANLQESYQRQQRFVADASHELRAPITSIRCNLDLLAQAPDLPPEDVRAALTEARAEANRMGRLVSDLLTLARADAAQQSISQDYKKSDGQVQLVDLDSLLLEVFRQYRRSGESEGDEKLTRGPRLMLQHIVPAKVYGDADQLKQAFVALLDNAFKYTPYEGSISLSLTADDDYATVKVSDTGIGILPEDLPHIFERFYRADPARSRDRGGSGLGLAIVQNIVQDHQGSIGVESTPGKGSTFTLKLPLAKVKNS
jgi:two-component system OmpR family sensor kinase